MPKQLAYKERRPLKNGGERWKVKYTDIDGDGRSQNFTTEWEADEFKQEVERLGRAKQAPAGKGTLAEYMAVWWDDCAIHDLEPRTLDNYANYWNRFKSDLGGVRMDELSPKVFDDFKRQALAAGAPPTMVAKCLQVCQTALRQARVWGIITIANPVPDVRKPTAPRSLIVMPTLTQVEFVRSQLIDAGRHNSAALVSVFAYAGLRPEEARALRWHDQRANTLLVHTKCQPDGLIVDGSKTDRRYRTVDLLPPLIRDLAEWRLRQGRPDDDQLIFPKNRELRTDHGWTDSDFRNWRNRVFKPAATAAEVPEPSRPYALRHMFASLLLSAPHPNHVDIARQLGHSTTMLLDNYGHVMPELTGRDIEPAAAIEEARAA